MTSQHKLLLLPHRKTIVLAPARAAAKYQLVAAFQNRDLDWEQFYKLKAAQATRDNTLGRPVIFLQTQDC